MTLQCNQSRIQTLPWPARPCVFQPLAMSLTSSPATVLLIRSVLLHYRSEPKSSCAVSSPFGAQPQNHFIRKLCLSCSALYLQVKTSSISRLANLFREKAGCVYSLNWWPSRCSFASDVMASAAEEWPFALGLKVPFQSVLSSDPRLC